MRTLIIGDIHGCFTELKLLIETANITDNDEIIAIGDIVDRGPDSVAVFQFLKNRPNTRVIMGNHERKHKNFFQGKNPAISQIITRQEFGEELYLQFISWIDTLPLFLDLPQALIIHGMLRR